MCKTLINTLMKKSIPTKTTGRSQAMRIALHEKFRRRTHMEFKTLMFETIVQYRATNRYESP